MILTGRKEVTNSSDPILTDPEFIDSLSFYSSSNYNEYFLNCIRLFLENCSYEERVDLLNVYQDNHILLLGTSILNGLLFDLAIAAGNDFGTVLDSIFSDYLTDGEVNTTLCIALYFYIENLSKINLINGTISRTVYQKAIKLDRKSVV